jgi:hypothetical protein
MSSEDKTSDIEQEEEKQQPTEGSGTGQAPEPDLKSERVQAE